MNSGEFRVVLYELLKFIFIYFLMMYIYNIITTKLNIIYVNNIWYIDYYKHVEYFI